MQGFIVAYQFQENLKNSYNFQIRIYLKQANRSIKIPKNWYNYFFKKDPHPPELKTIQPSKEKPILTY